MLEQQHRKVQEEPWTGESRFWIQMPSKPVEPIVSQPVTTGLSSIPEDTTTDVSANVSTPNLGSTVHGPYPAASTPSSSPETSTYGPVRVRQQKGPEMFVFRPVQTQAEDLIDALQEMSEERSEAH